MTGFYAFFSLFCSLTLETLGPTWKTLTFRKFPISGTKRPLGEVSLCRMLTDHLKEEQLLGGVTVGRLIDLQGHHLAPVWGCARPQALLEHTGS